jgi:hypothetical protein
MSEKNLLRYIGLECVVVLSRPLFDRTEFFGVIYKTDNNEFGLIDNRHGGEVRFLPETVVEVRMLKS